MLVNRGTRTQVRVAIRSLEFMQKIACKVRLKQWDQDYNSMLQLLDIPPLSTRRKYLKAHHYV